MIAGVCNGLGERFGISVSLLRALFLIASIFSFGSPILLYFLYIVNKIKIKTANCYFYSHLPLKTSFKNLFGNQNECLVILLPSGKISVSDSFPFPTKTPGSISYKEFEA